MELETRPERIVRSGAKPELRVERTEITFHSLGDDKVRIQITVRNVGEARSTPTTMTVESAPLGAFVPWRPLVRLPVPAIEPGESRAVSVEVARPHPKPLGSFGRVPPNRLLTAVNSPDQPSRQPVNGILVFLNHLRRQQRARSGGQETAKGPFLAPDLWDLVDRGQPHWAGNLNVFIGQHAVERHLARALRVYPGRTNLALFIVGGPGTRDAYAFEIAGLPPEWEAALFVLANQSKPLIDSMQEPIEPRRWVESAGGLVVMLATHPPAGCHAGKLDVHVKRRSCGKEAIVEFDIDPAAQGAGCYFV